MADETEARTRARRPRILTAPPSVGGLILGALFFAAALTPSLIPRAVAVQAVLAGVAFAAGYGVAALVRMGWRGLELPEPPWRILRWIFALAGLVALTVLAVSLWSAAGWQDGIRLRMGMEPTLSAHPFRLLAIALPTSLLLIGLGRLLVWAVHLASDYLQRHLSPRASMALGMVLVGLVVFLLAQNLLQRGVLRGIDASAQQLDALIRPDLPPPEDPMLPGSAASLIAWDDLGREGRDFVAATPAPETLADVTGGPAQRPVRVYAGLNAADSAHERAELALAELIRVGGFERSVLVVAMPTGTGWMDPAAIEPLEHLHRGDVATVGIQYSYLQSWISLLVEPEYSSAAGRALFAAVHGHWRALPPGSRPRLYLYGLSLGAYSSQGSMQLHEIIDQPIHGAFWVGAPFVSGLWRTLTDERQPGSPAWLPRLSEGNVVRFTDGRQGLEDPNWSGLRIVYLQYASDPIVFFERDAAFRRPGWFAPPMGPDVSPDLRWYPVVSFLQLLADMAISLVVPIGHGHFYHPVHHIEAWRTLTDPPGWDAAGLARLHAHFEARAREMAP